MPLEGGDEMYVHLPTQRMSADLPEQVLVEGLAIRRPTLADAAKAGWREVVGPYPPTPTPGYVVTAWRFEQDPENALCAKAVTIEEITEEEYAQRQAEAEEQARRAAASPIVFERPVETPALVLQSWTAKIGYGLAMSDDGQLLTYVEHASPGISPEERAARIAAAKAAHAEKVAQAKAAQHGQLQERVEALERFLGLRD